MPGILNHGHMHTQANAQKWNVIFSGISDGFNFAVDTSVAEATRHQNRIKIF